MLFAYVVCSLLVAEVYSFNPIRFRDGSQSDSVDRPKQHRIVRLPLTPVPVGPYPHEPIRHPYHPEGDKQQQQGNKPVNPPNKPERHPKQQKPHENREAEADRIVRKIYDDVVKANNYIDNDPRKQYDLVGKIIDAAYGDNDAERSVQEFLRGSPNGEESYNQIRQEIKKLLNQLDNVEGSDRADKLSRVEGEINRIVYRLYNEVVHSTRRRLKFIKFVLDGAAGDEAAGNIIRKHYAQYPEDVPKLGHAVEEAVKDIYEVRRLYDNALSARQVAEQVKGYALDVELGNN